MSTFVVSETDILDFKPEYGKEQLCRSLAKFIPEGLHYPYIIQPDKIITLHKYIWWFTLTNIILKVGRQLRRLWVGGLAI